MFEGIWVLVFLLLFFFFLFKRRKPIKEASSVFQDVAVDRRSDTSLESRSTPSKRSSYPRRYLDVPFAEKEAAKACGAKWDAGKKLWYAPAWAASDDLKPWPSIDEKIDIIANKAQIATTDERCYRCGKITPVSAVYLPNGWEVRDYDYDDWSRIGVGGFLQFSTYLSPTVSKALKASPAKIDFSFSKTAGHSYWMNLCAHCGAKQGDFYLFETGGPFFDAFCAKSQSYTISEPIGPVHAAAGIVSYG
ncbi:DUF5710 domain-containing protein [Paremcibacter congregatus]|uniref:DUF5710 domain-containing protein n=1 Tax=Paremcibacter congregatus TaxID=2043170 RepID=UPI003A8CA91B